MMWGTTTMKLANISNQIETTQKQKTKAKTKKGGKKG